MELTLHPGESRAHRDIDRGPELESDRDRLLDKPAPPRTFAESAKASGSSGDGTISYRSDIDGLRALAVISVILFHLDRTFMPNGFLGVDMFFVISGFLITGIMDREFSRGEFSIFAFYERRARRILPALLAVLSATTIACSVLLLPVDLSHYAETTFYTLGFSANIFFSGETDYFGRAAELEPLLHMWSLGVEEQFYLLYPVFLIPCLKFIGRKNTVALLLAVVACSLWTTLNNATEETQAAAFFLLPSRAWELCAGGIVALLPTFRPARTSFATCISFIALAIIAAALLGVLPSGVSSQYAIVEGIVLLIFVGAGAKGNVVAALSPRPVRFTGRISYSLYLWHWPVVVLGKYWLIGPPNLLDLAMMAGATFILAVASWYYVERPFRSGGISTKLLTAYCISGIAAVSAASAAFVTTGGLPSRFSPEIRRISAVIDTNYRCDEPGSRFAPNVKICRLGSPFAVNGDADVVLLGNSYMQMYAPLIGDILNAHGLKGLLVASNGCLPMTQVNISSECFVPAEQQIEIAVALRKARLAIVSMRWNPRHGGVAYRDGTRPDGTSVNAVIAGFDNTAARIERSGKAVLLVGPIATPRDNIASIWARSLAFGRHFDKPRSGPKTPFLRSYGSFFTHFGNGKAARLVRPDLVQCPETECVYEMNGQPLFSDDNHLGAPGLSPFRNVFETAILSALAIPNPPRHSG